MFTPKPMPTAQMTTHSERPHTAAIIVAMMSTGKAMRMSTSTATDSRTQRTVSAPRPASAMPMTVAITPAPTATNTVVRAPAMRRLRMSRPDPSVPSRCGQLGPAQRAEMSVVVGENGVQKRAMRAVSAMSSTTATPNRPVDSDSRRRSQPSRGVSTAAITTPSGAGR